MGGFVKGLVYPVPPEVETAADKRAWTEMKEYLLKGDPIAGEVLKKTAAYLNNVLEPEIRTVTAQRSCLRESAY